jgi:hypothetical protein
LRYKTWVETIVEPKLLELAGTKRVSLSDWEFAFRVERHRSELTRASYEEAIEATARLNAANAERVRLVGEIDMIMHRPLWRVIGSRVKSGLLSTKRPV